MKDLKRKVNVYYVDVYNLDMDMNRRKFRTKKSAMEEYNNIIEKHKTEDLGTELRFAQVVKSDNKSDYYETIAHCRLGLYSCNFLYNIEDPHTRSGVSITLNSLGEKIFSNYSSS